MKRIISISLFVLTLHGLPLMAQQTKMSADLIEKKYHEEKGKITEDASAKKLKLRQAFCNALRKQIKSQVDNRKWDIAEQILNLKSDIERNPEFECSEKGKYNAILESLLEKFSENKEKIESVSNAEIDKLNEKFAKIGSDFLQKMGDADKKEKQNLADFLSSLNATFAYDKAEIVPPLGFRRGGLASHIYRLNDAAKEELLNADKASPGYKNQLENLLNTETSISKSSLSEKYAVLSFSDKANIKDDYWVTYVYVGAIFVPKSGTYVACLQGNPSSRIFIDFEPFDALAHLPDQKETMAEIRLERGWHYLRIETVRPTPETKFNFMIGPQGGDITPLDPENMAYTL